LGHRGRKHREKGGDPMLKTLGEKLPSSRWCMGGGMKN